MVDKSDDFDPFHEFMCGCKRNPTNREESHLLLARILMKLDSDSDDFRQLGRVISSQGSDRATVEEIERILQSRPSKVL